MNDTTLLLEMLASRICHDLISPVGAIHNGIEFLDEMGADALEDALDLMRHSTLQSTVKLKAFRLAYGAGGRDPSVKPEDVYTAINEYVALEGKIEQDWDAHGDITQIDFNGFPKILMGTLLLATEVLVKGGRLQVEKDGDTAKVIASGEDFLLRESIMDALGGETDVEDIDPRSVTAYLLGLNAKDLGLNVEIEPSDTQIAFIISEL
ncbi:MAG: histidine phosphotransferase family protein [Bdellovibrionales bacterium]